MDAQGSLDSLLGRLTTVLVNEPQRLGLIRGDVEFIKDEMESMNGLLLHLTEAQHRDHQVRAWRKQVAGVSRDCESNVELYIHYVGRGPGGGNGVMRYLRRIPFFLRTVPIRRRIASRIRELKVRARDVGDRRLRHGVTVPDLPATAAGAANTYDDGDDAQSPRTAAEEEEDRRRRSALLDGDEPHQNDDVLVRQGVDYIIKCLSQEEPSSATAGHGQKTQPRYFPIFGNTFLGKRVAEEVYEHSSVARSFDCKAFVKPNSYEWFLRDLLVDIIEQVTPPDQEGDEQPFSMKQLIRKLRGLLKGKRFLMVLADVTAEYKWNIIMEALLQAADGCHPGSAIVNTTNIDQVATWPAPCDMVNVMDLKEFYTSKADKLKANYTYWDDTYRQRLSIFGVCYPNAYAMKMFLHLLYVNPNRTSDELEKYNSALSECKRLNKSTAKQVVMFCYNELPSKYRSCLLYLTIFPKGHIVRTTTLARRWIAEGLITSTATTGDEIQSSMDEAEHYLDVLFTRGFVSPLEISVAGKIKSFTIRHEVREVIAKIARDVNFVEANLPTDLAHHLSIHNRIGLQAYHSNDGIKDILTFLPVLAASSQWQLLKLLDLEGCKGLRKHLLKSICKILFLKYLSLRNTDVTELPDQIKKLQFLETLDIQQTQVPVLARKAIVLRRLKHFLAGHKVSASNDDADRFEEMFSTVCMPLKVQRMENMEILSNVKVSESNKELAGIGRLLKLRKFGVTLHGERATLDDLFHQVKELHRSLRSLSIRIVGQPAAGGNHDAEMVVNGTSPLEFIESLNINGLTHGLHDLIQGLPHLVKLTLCCTNVSTNDLSTIGNLCRLRSLKLQYKSYTENELVFKVKEFQSLNFLLVEGNNITNISFVTGAAPKLERIIWSFAIMDALSGINHLPNLTWLELNGNCSLDSVMREIHIHRNRPVLKHTPHPQHQEAATAVVASSSSAPSAPNYSPST